MPPVQPTLCQEIYDLCMSKTSYTHQTLEELSKSVDDCAKAYTVDQLVLLSQRWNAMPVDMSAFDKDRLNTVDSIPDKIPSNVENRTSYLKGEREALCRDALQVGALKPGGSGMPSGGLPPTGFLWQTRGREAIKRG